MKVDANYKLKLAAGQSVGGNPSHLAPEIQAIALSMMNSGDSYIEVDYSKQTSWEFDYFVSKSCLAIIIPIIIIIKIRAVSNMHH